MLSSINLSLILTKPTKSREEDICWNSCAVYWCLQSINYHIAAVKWKGLLYDSCPCRAKHTLIKGKGDAWKLWTQLLVGTRNCRKNLRVSHDTTLSIYDDFRQNRFFLSLLTNLTKLLIKSNMAIHKWWVKASSALQHYYHCWTCLGHSIIPNIPTSAWIWQWPSHRKHAGNSQTVFWSFPSLIQWTVIGETPQCHSFMDPQCPFDV